MIEDKIIKYIINNSHKSTRQLEKETKINRNKISKILKDNGVNKDSRMSDYEKNFILNNKEMEYEELSRILNRPVTTIKGFLNRNKIYKYKEFNPNIDSFKIEYEKKTMLEMCEYYDVCKDTILKYIDNNGLKRKSDYFREKKLLELKHKLEKTPIYDYFKTIDSHQKSYFIGLIASDGSVHNKKANYENSQNTMQITLKSNDRHILEILHRELNTGRKCTIGNNGNTCSFQIASDDICEDISKYGIIYNKTWNLNISNIPLEYIPSFLLGYFDGDGSISKSETISKTNVSICGTESTIKSISNMLDYRKLKYSIIEDKRYHKYKGRFFSIVFKNTSEKYSFLKTIYSIDCENLIRKKSLAFDFFYKVENNATNRSENIKAINDFNNAVLSRNA